MRWGDVYHAFVVVDAVPAAEIEEVGIVALREFAGLLGIWWAVALMPSPAYQKERTSAAWVRYLGARSYEPSNCASSALHSRLMNGASSSAVA